MTHIIQVDRKETFTSDSLPADALAQLATTFRNVRWWRDRWRDRTFRDVARRIMRARGGLVLIGPGVKLDLPDAFDEFFEAIEICNAFSTGDQRLKNISGETPTRQERFGRVIKHVGLVVLAVMAAGLAFLFRHGIPSKLVVAGGVSIFIIGLTLFSIHLLTRRRARFFLVPGGIAVVRHRIRRGQPPRITIFSRNDTCLAFRLVSTGKTVILVMELWTHLGRVVRRAITEREAISVIAVWRGTQEPLEDDRLLELVGD